MKQLSAVLFLSMVCVLPLSAAEADILTIEIKAIQEQIVNLENLDYDKRKLIFPELNQKIESLPDSTQKKLLLASLFVNFPGEKRENATKAIAIAENFKKEGANLYEANCIIAKAYLAKLGLAFLFFPISEWIDKEDIAFREKAIQSIDSAIMINKQSSDAYRIKAELMEGNEKIELFEKSIQLDSSNNKAWRGLVSELTTKKRYDEALRSVLLWLQNDLTDEYKIEAYLKAGRIFQDKKELGTAVSWFLKAEMLRNSSGKDALDQLYSGSDEIYSLIAGAYFESKDYSNAETYYRKYLGLRPDASYVRFNLARLYAESGQVESAIVEYNQVLGYDASNTSAIYNLALLYKAEEPEKAKELFRKYIELKKDLDYDDAKTWVSNAKSQLMSLGVYDFPKSKKELAAEKRAQTESRIQAIVAVSIFGIIIYLGLKFRKITKWIIIVSMLIAVVLICLYEADNGANLGRAFLYFIPVISIGGFLLYILKPKKAPDDHAPH